MKIKLIIYLFLFCCFSCKQDGPEVLLEGNFVYATPRGMRYIRNNNCEFVNFPILPNVIDYEYNENYILIEQLPDIEDSKILLAGKLATYSLTNDRCNDIASEYSLFSKSIIKDVSQHISKNFTIEDQMYCKSKIEEMFKTEDFFIELFNGEKKYYIIDIANGNIFGPLSISEYHKKRKAFKLPKKFRM